MSLVLERAASYRPRWQREDLGGGVRFRIPARKRWFAIVPAIPWLVMWAVAEGNVIGQIQEKAVGGLGGLLLIWLALWTLSGIFVLGFLLWQLTGESTVEVSGGMLRVRRGFGALAVGRTYDVQLIRNLRASRMDVDPDDLIWWRRSYLMPISGLGQLRFDYGERAVTFRPDLEPSEATNLANYLNRYLPFGMT
jgi:hypothetical protein